MQNFSSSFEISKSAHDTRIDWQSIIKLRTLSCISSIDKSIAESLNIENSFYGQQIHYL